VKQEEEEVEQEEEKESVKVPLLSSGTLLLELQDQ